MAEETTTTSEDPKTTSDQNAKDAAGDPAAGKKVGKAAAQKANEINQGADEVEKLASQGNTDEDIADRYARDAHRPAIADGPLKEDVDVDALAGPTVDDFVAAESQAKHPGSPLYDPNTIPVHENRINIGRRIQTLQRDDHQKLYKGE